MTWSAANKIAIALALVLVGSARGQFIFAPAQFLPVGAPASQQIVMPVVADFNGDGRPDLLLGESFSSGQVYVHLLAGTGTSAFGPPQHLALGPTTNPSPGPNFSGPLGVVDANADGWPDVVIIRETASGGSALALLLNNGSGSFTQTAIGQGVPAFTSVLNAAVGDLDSDGGVDVVITAPLGVPSLPMVLKVYSLSATGFVFGEVLSIIENQFVNPVVMADINGDGLKDVVYQRGIGSPVVVEVMALLRQAGGGFVPAGPFSWPPVSGQTNQVFSTLEFVVADLNADGRSDLVGFGDGAVGPSNAVIATLLGTVSGSLAPGSTYTTTVPAQVFGPPVFGRCSVGDFDLDGALELHTQSRISRLAPMFNGSNTMSLDNSALPANPPNGMLMEGEFAADVDQDGDLDIIQVARGFMSSAGFLSQTFVGIAINRTVLSAGCGSPIVLSVGTPAPGNPAFQVLAGTAIAGTSIALGLSQAEGFLPVGSCTVRLDLASNQLVLPSGSLGIMTTDAAGMAQMTFTVPNVPGMLGSDYFLQWIAADASGPISLLGLNYSLSGARRIVLW